MSIPTSPSRVSFHSIKQSTSLWDPRRQVLKRREVGVGAANTPPRPHPHLACPIAVSSCSTTSVEQHWNSRPNLQRCDTHREPKVEGGWRTTHKDTADVVKPEVRGSIDARDQGQFGWRRLWMWIYCTVSCFPAVRFCLRLLSCTATGSIVADFWAPTRLVQRLSCCSNCNFVHYVHVSSVPFIVFVIFVLCRFPSLLVGLVQCLSLICKEVKHIPKVLVKDYKTCVTYNKIAVCQQANLNSMKDSLA